MNFEAKDYLPKENFKFLSLVQNEEHILCDLETPERSPPPRLYTPNEVKPAYNIQINDTVKEEKPSLIALQADIKNEILETQLEEELLPKEFREKEGGGPQSQPVKKEHSELDPKLNMDFASKRRDEEEPSYSSQQCRRLRHRKQKLMESCANIENCKTVKVQQISKNKKEINFLNKVNGQASPFFTTLQLDVCDSSNILVGSNKDHSSNCKSLTCKITNKSSRSAIVKPQEKSYCEICKRSYKRLNKHVDQVHSNVKKYVCYVCCKGYSSRAGLAQHNQTNHTTSLYKYKCKKCYKCYQDKTALEKHLKQSHLHVKSNKIVNNNTACDVCQKVFDCKANMQAHRVRQHKSKSEYFICNDCSASYPNKILLSMHIKSNHLPPELNCSLCSKCFTTKQKLEQHLRTEHGIDKRKTFVCETCGKTFWRKLYLERHIMIHTDSKQYVCEECGKSFRTTTNLSQHSVIHSNFRPFSCDLCGKSFRIRHHLKQHMATHGMASTPNYGKIARSKRNKKCDEEISSSDGSSN